MFFGFMYIWWRNVYSSSLSSCEVFVFLWLRCKSSLYTLDTRPSYHIWFANIFSFSVGYLYTFLIVPSDIKKYLFLWNWIHFFSFVYCFVCVTYKNPLSNQGHEDIYPHSSKSFVALTLTLQLLIHFALIFVSGVR